MQQKKYSCTAFNTSVNVISVSSENIGILMFKQVNLSSWPNDQKHCKVPVIYSRKSNERTLTCCAVDMFLPHSTCENLVLFSEKDRASWRQRIETKFIAVKPKAWDAFTDVCLRNFAPGDRHIILIHLGLYKAVVLIQIACLQLQVICWPLFSCFLVQHNWKMPWGGCSVLTFPLRFPQKWQAFYDWVAARRESLAVWSTPNAMVCHFVLQ